jgi:hypothetical protein
MSPTTDRPRKFSARIIDIACSNREAALGNAGRNSDVIGGAPGGASTDHMRHSRRPGTAITLILVWLPTIVLVDLSKVCPLPGCNFADAEA